MKPRIDPSPELLRLVGQQAGAVTTEQAFGLGLDRHSVGRLVRDGHWQRMCSGLLYVGYGEPDWAALAWGGVLLGGDDARLAGRAAAHLHGLEEQPPGTISVKTPWGVQRLDRGPWVFERERGGVRGRGTGHPPRTSVEDTILDLAAELDDRDLIGLVTQATQSRRTTVRRLRARMAERNKVAHRRLLTDLLADVAEGAESPLEVGYFRDVERAHGLPRGTRQHVNLAGDRRDVRYDEFATVVELDGRRGHEGMGRFRDMRRDNQAVVSGEVTLRYGHLDVFDRACLVAWQVGGVLGQRGWAGIPDRCRNCRRVSTSV
ncbi:MAG TPA: type IV toxin-antitoxin system AbiEi family antitoxin domain-containing protein [Propionibacteriaceae bacterium]